MKMLFKIAWRNIWRNPRRSWVLITSIAVGILGYLGTIAFSRGFVMQMIETVINLQGGHLMIQPRGYYQNPRIGLKISKPERIEKILDQLTIDVNYAPFVSFQGMINSAEAATGVIIYGVDPYLEPNITIVSSSITQGRYLTAGKGGEIVIGERLAKKLKVRLGEKVVLMATDMMNNINSGAFRIVGLFHTTSPDFDRSHAFIHLNEAQAFIGYSNEITGISVRLQNEHLLETLEKTLETKLTGLPVEILTWKERNPLVVLSLEAYDAMVILIIVILFSAIAFSIANVFLMVIYERIREFGIMMANGTKPKNIVIMLFLEALLITFIGLISGFTFSVAYLSYWQHVGLDLSAFAKGLAKFGVGSHVYPEIIIQDILWGIMLITVIVLISVIYPAVKAARFKVVEAISFA
ncbi:MAG: ABC transporter permease [Calditrichaeota bacterium]|nr:MAG: ABC transporter permease [Calditrichota bacterium]